MGQESAGPASNIALYQYCMGAFFMSRGHRIPKPRFWLMLIGVFALFSACVFASQAYYMRLQEKTLSELTDRRDTLLNEKTDLQRKLLFMDTKEYIIREAREKLGLLMPGEILFESAD